jgi:16S rRNA (guanine(966)-N(2))-methyltransferase RsmD
MRIISGKHKGRRVTAPKNLPVRPTTDMAKEALFNILNNRFYFDEIKVLDLFSGIGSISLEFASRGTNQITSVDKHYACVQFLNKTATNFDLQIQTIKSDVYSFLEKEMNTYDVIFADPPYDFSLEQFEKISKMVFKKKLLNKDGVLIIEHSKNTNLDELDYFSNKRKYGGNHFSFFETT